MGAKFIIEHNDHPLSKGTVHPTVLLLLHPYSPNTRRTAEICARLSTIPRDPSVEWMPVEPAKFLLLAVVEKLTGAVSYS